jgi:hypothetical protein
MNKALEKERYRRLYLEQLQTNAKCPFKILNFGCFTRVLYDFSKCTRDSNSCDQDCKQTYMNVTDIIPKRGHKKKQVTPAEVEVGCIYISKQREHSMETAGPGSAKRVV